MPNDRPNNWLSQCANDKEILTYTSQRGEDRILQRLFVEIGTKNKWCVEFGATDGKAKSNTWYWINKQNWWSVQIEPARDINLGLRDRERWSYDALIERYATNDRVTCLNRWVDVSGPNRLDALLAQTALPRQFDLLSIDVDGADFAIWQTLSNYQPRVVVIEHNKTIPIEVSFYSDRGSSLLSIVELGKQKGYELAAANDLNAIFVLAADFPKLGIVDNSPATLWPDHEQHRLTLEHTGNKLVFHGPNKLRWLRGADGTLAGQIRSGQYIQIASSDHTIPARAERPQRQFASGFIRHWYYSLLRNNK